MAVGDPPVPSAISEATGALDAVVPAQGPIVSSLRKTVRTTTEARTAIADVVRSPVTTVVEAVRPPIADSSRQVVATARSTLGERNPAPRPSAERARDGSAPTGAIGRPDAKAGRHPSSPTTSAGSSVLVGDQAATAARSDVAAVPRPEGAASSTSSNGGQDDRPGPGGPGATTGGVSGPLGFVLIAAVLAFVFGFAPRIISTSLRMSSEGGRDAALALPLDRPD